ncbi:ArgP/LysG family DNA-binding transcriptional regulator [Glutamicibacter sp. NPDC087344]|uniref:ArgP/LysG family DNA-binding transcriptional regulator n=1 Tax=Glutamicibacter sp. NPDC087344 TaxID=3363994 RepID=UPI00382F84B3
MNFDVEHLQTLLAVVDAGSFDDASIDLGVTPSAVSQRIKALENRVGTVLVVRSRPVVPTEQGSKVLRYARQIAALSAEFSHEISRTGHQHVAVGVNADSLSTWFTPVFDELARWTDVSVEILRMDEGKSLDMLRSGRVSAVVTNSAEAAQGCTVRKLGALRYRAVCNAQLAAKFFASAQSSGLLEAPMIIFDREDGLQHRLLTHAGVDPSQRGSAMHMVPDSWQFVHAIQAGMGWGMIPEQQLAQVEGLQEIDEQWFIDVPLYFQRWSVDSEILRKLEAVLLQVASDSGIDLLT